MDIKELRNEFIKYMQNRSIDNLWHREENVTYDELIEVSSELVDIVMDWFKDNLDLQDELIFDE